MAPASGPISLAVGRKFIGGAPGLLESGTIYDARKYEELIMGIAGLALENDSTKIAGLYPGNDSTDSGDEGHDDSDFNTDAGDRGRDSVSATLSREAKDAADDRDKYRIFGYYNKPEKISQRRLTDQAAWDRFFIENSDDIARDSSNQGGPSAKNPHLPSRNPRHPDGTVIANPREYQLELFERCKARNTIVVLDTGAGKTLIAALLLRHVLEKELDDRAVGKPKKLAFFLVDKVALVDQQFNVLHRNLSFPVVRYCGHTSEKIWTRTAWDDIREKYMAMVCTAAILQKALSLGYVYMTGTNLLIFDEAHHAKKNHVYSRIVRDFYHPLAPREERPRIMGMTASPVDAKEDIKLAAERLESCLSSVIATVSEEDLTRGLEKKNQREQIRYYPPLSSEPMTPLYKAIGQCTGNVAYFERLMSFARTATTQLGPWVSDYFLHKNLCEEELVKVGAKCERDLVATNGRAATYESVALDVLSVLEDFPIGEVKRTNEYLSEKVLCLLDLLHGYYAGGNISRGIVFVEMRYTATLLCDLLKQPACEIPGLKPAALFGADTAGEIGSGRMSMLSQRVTLSKFRDGEFNCLIATSVAEEGIDVPQCDLVIRFDLYSSMIQYVQSKGRARHLDSVYINMAQHTNGHDMARMEDARHEANLLHKFCTSLPEDRKVQLDRYFLGCNDYPGRYLRVGVSGARVTWTGSLEVVAKFVASLPRVQGMAAMPTYAVTFAGAGVGYRCHLIMPEGSPVRGVEGSVERSAKSAKCSAAFEMCKFLVKKGYINNHLEPIFARQLPAIRNCRLAVSLNKKSEYNMRIKPQMWSSLGQPEALYGAALVLDHPAAMGHPSCPLVLLTREPLPDLPAFPLYFDKGKDSLVRIVSLPFVEPLRVSEREAGSLTDFTLKIFTDVFTKTFECTSAELPYFIAPCILEHGYSFTGTTMSLRAMIKWDDVEAVSKSEYVEWAFGDPDAVFENRFLIDRFDGSRKFFSHRVRPDMMPNTLVPKGVVPPRNRRWRRLADDAKTVLEYSNSKWNENHEYLWNTEQKVVECGLVPLRRNLLDEVQEPETERTCWVVIEPLRMSTLRAEVAAMALTFPAIIHRVESHLIALDACKLLGLEIRPDLALEAITKDSDNTDEHGKTQVNLRKGMGTNYERLEFLGDTFLKMATSISIVTHLPNACEMEFHVERMLLICNKNLFNGAVDRNLQEYIRSCQFERHGWYPQGLKRVKGKEIRCRTVHPLSDKTIADVCEALIGAAYLTYLEAPPADGHGFDMAVRTVTALVKGKLHAQTSFAEYYQGYEIPAWQKGPPFMPSHVDLALRLKEAAGYEFKSAALARCAFKHPSYPYDPSVPNYQSLEFLGDALLDTACVEFLYLKFPKANPQWLTEHKAAMVSNQFLGCLAVRLGFNRHVLTTDSSVMSQIREYVDDLEVRRLAAEARAQGKDINDTDIDGGGGNAEDRAADGSGRKGKGMKKVGVNRDYDDDDGDDGDDDEGDDGNDDDAHAESTNLGYWVKARNAPKVLADVVEAYVGAVFVDSCYEYGRVRDFFEAHVRPFFANMSIYDSFAKRHPMHALQLRLNEKLGCSVWRLMTSDIAPSVEERGVGVLTETRVVVGLMVHNKVFKTAVSSSSRYAKIAVAKKALSELRQLSVEEFKARVGCDCGAGRSGRGDPGTAV